jgi:hypothetical protein
MTVHAQTMLADRLQARADTHDKQCSQMGIGYYSGNDARLMRDAAYAIRSAAIGMPDDARAALEKLIQRHASAYVARGCAISDSIIAECKASREALLAALATIPREPGEIDPFNRKQVEAVCRAVCGVEGIDPDSDVYGDECDPQWSRYADAVASALSPANANEGSTATIPREPCPQCQGTHRALYFSEQGWKHEERDCHLCSSTEGK